MIQVLQAFIESAWTISMLKIAIEKENVFKDAQIILFSNRYIASEV